jgi:NAD(P)-dependent dehydrogenase (short-subunit alcohol dehydrogenase family)
MASSAQIEIPSQRGRSAVVTGATGGLGYETALALAKAGAAVILTGRDDRKGLSAIEKIGPSPISRSGCIPDSRWIF